MKYGNLEDGFYWVIPVEGMPFTVGRLTGRHWDICGTIATFKREQPHLVARRIHAPAMMPPGNAPFDALKDVRQLMDTGQEMVNEVIEIGNAEPAPGDFSITLKAHRRQGKTLVDINMTVPKGRK